MEDLRYPIGKFSVPLEWNKDIVVNWIREIEDCPSKLKEAVNGLNKDQLATPYRPDGWTVQQVVHHLADSHLNSYIRFKWVLTENEPTIKTYDEVKWAELNDAQSDQIDVSINLLEALHRRWVIVLKGLSSKDLKLKFNHPENGLTQLSTNVALYAWHGKHHIAHINSLRKRKNW